MEKRFAVEQKDLVNLLASMQPICTKRTTLDTTASILFQVGHKELILKSTDLEISLQANCMLQESSLTQTEKFLVPGKRIFETVREFDGVISFTLKAGQLVMTSGGVTLALNIKDAQEFPPFPECIENLMETDAPFFLKMLDRVAFLVPQNNVNPALNGLFVEIDGTQLTMTATDGHCLSQVRTTKYTVKEPKSWLIPRRAIIELKKILDSFKDRTVFIGICGNRLVFSGEQFNFFTKLLVDTFPQYRPILDKTAFAAAAVDRSSLIKTLRRSACLLSGQFLATLFAFGPETVRVSLKNKEVGSLDEELSVDGWKDKNVDIRFYAPYVLNGIQTFDDEKMTFYLNSGVKPIIFESHANDIDLTYLVMPVAPTAAAGSDE